MVYGFNEVGNEYLIQTLVDGSWSNRRITNTVGAFGNFSSEIMRLTAFKGNTDAVSDFGSTTHAVLMFVFGD